MVAPRWLQSFAWIFSLAAAIQLVDGFHACPSVKLAPSTSPLRFVGRVAETNAAVASSTTALASHGGPHSTEAYEAIASMDPSQWGLIGQVVQSPIFWTTSIMISIVILLFSWEKTIASARSKLPETLQPVVDSMLVEMGGLGFVGLFLGIAVLESPLGIIIGQLSEKFLGNEEILLESFEFLHTAFFEVGIAFFLIAGVTVASVVKQVESIEMVSRSVFDLNGDGVVELGEIAEVLNVDQVVVDLDGDGVLSDEEISLALDIVPRPTFMTELTRTGEVARAEALMVRERLLLTYDIEDEENFRLENYFVRVFGKNLEEIVELSPLTWLPLIPVVAQGRSIDLSRDIVSASSSNAFESCGEFISSPGYLAASTTFCVVAVVWAVWNFWKMVKIKDMLVPTLVRDSAAGGDAVLLPPRYEDADQMKKFNSSPFPFSLIESIWGKPGRNSQESLFGVAGRKGPSLYRNSIKLQTWFVVAQLVFFLTQIVARDTAALLQGIPSKVGRPDMLLPELGLYGFYCCLAIGQLWLVPKTFLDYSLVTSIEKLVSAEIMTEACLLDDLCNIEDDEDSSVSPSNATAAVSSAS